MSELLFGKAKLLPGRPWPLGSSYDGKGINFAVCSAEATLIELCLFGPENQSSVGGEFGTEGDLEDKGRVELARLALPKRTNDVWHGYLPDAKPGLLYGFRAHGPWQPEQGLRFNPHKLLLDPYAREIAGRYIWRDEHFAHLRSAPESIDPRDNAAWALKARVIPSEHNSFDWEGDQLLHTPLSETIIYELHVKGFSKINNKIPETLRGSFAGLADPTSIAHLKKLGITAVNLLPVHFAIDEERLVKVGLSNYWGYNSLGFFALNPRLVSTGSQPCPRDEFRNMVKALHRSGIEVLLDVVYNHTAESDEAGPSLSFRGLDNRGYYRLPESNKASYENHTGCGNTLDLRQARVLQLALDSLRYWVEEMHVDGFRFDLATVLGRGQQGFDPAGAFFMSLAQDPVLSRVKLIAEPWDIGPSGYQVGNFPAGWLEWNDQFRDTTRRFWLHPDRPKATRGEFAMRLCASSDLFQKQGRIPAASVNYVVSHDGFTLRDLVCYEERHNHANGENNRDGHGHNLSFNAGVEGPTTQLEIEALRAQLQRTLLACTLLSQGTPMLCAGDELGHTQAGNNNPYCQDNEITWIDWAKSDQDLINFASQVMSIRKRFGPFGDHWYTDSVNAKGQTDLAWLAPSGQVLQAQDWRRSDEHAFACVIYQAKPESQCTFAFLFNPEHQEQAFNLEPGKWELLMDSSMSRKPGQACHQTLAVSAYSLVLLKRLSID